MALVLAAQGFKCDGLREFLLPLVFFVFHLVVSMSTVDEPKAWGAFKYQTALCASVSLW